MTDICKLNNEAAFCIENKDYQRSIQLLQEAAKQIRVVMTTATQETSEQQESSCADNGASMCRFLTGSKSNLNSCFLDKPSTRNVEETSRYSVFASPIIFNHVVSLFEPLAFERVSYVLVYNLALAHHCMAIQYENNAAQCSSSSEDQRQAQHAIQQKALVLYEKSHCLLVRASDNWDVSVLHSLSILCNLGHLHHMMGAEDKSEMCYQNLLSTICCIVESRGGAAPAECDVVTGELLDCFFGSVMPLLQKGSVAAAA